MHIELYCRRLDHPCWNLFERSVWEDDGSECLTATGYAPPDSNHRSVMRMEAIVDLNFIVLIVGTMCPIRPVGIGPMWAHGCWH
jgi:hypothetical protein